MMENSEISHGASDWAGLQLLLRAQADPISSPPSRQEKRIFYIVFLGLLATEKRAFVFYNKNQFFIEKISFLLKKSISNAKNRFLK